MKINTLYHGIGLHAVCNRLLIHQDASFILQVILSILPGNRKQKALDFHSLLHQRAVIRCRIDGICLYLYCFTNPVFYKAGVISLPHIPGRHCIITIPLQIAGAISQTQRHGKVQQDLILLNHGLILSIVIQMQLFSVIEIICIGTGNRIQISHLIGTQRQRVDKPLGGRNKGLLLLIAVLFMEAGIYV